MNFSEKMSELENILKKLEGESESIEDSLAEFERGIALVRECRSYLEEAKQRVLVLTENGEETFKK